MKKVKLEVIDSDEKIHGVPMLTSDGEEIAVNKIIYTATYNSSYGFKGKVDACINAFVVLSVNTSKRCFRIRCKKGCEELISLNGNCSVDLYFSSLQLAKESVYENFRKDIERFNGEVERVKKGKQDLMDKFIVFKQLTTKEVGLPKGRK